MFLVTLEAPINLLFRLVIYFDSVSTIYDLLSRLDIQKNLAKMAEGNKIYFDFLISDQAKLDEVCVLY